MPFVLYCPHCRRQLTAHETQAGQVVGCPTCRGPVAVPAPPAALPVIPGSPFGELEDVGDEDRPFRSHRGRDGGVTGVKAFVWGCALVPILLITGVVAAAFLRVIPGGITDLAIIAAAALIAIVVAIAFAVDRMLGG